MIADSLIGLMFLISLITIYFVIRQISQNKRQKELEILKKKYPKKAEEFWTHMAIQSRIDEEINKK